MDDNDYPPEAIQAREALEDLNYRVYEAIELGIERSLDYFGEREPNPWLFSHIVRYEATQRLKEDGNQTISLRENPMSGVEILHNGFRIRIWKKHLSDQYLQPPGQSPSRQAFYFQPPIPEFSHLIPISRNVVYVWEPNANAGLDLWLVSPNGFENIWEPGDSLWEIPIPHPALAMEPVQDFSEDDDADLPIFLDEAEPDEEA